MSKDHLSIPLFLRAKINIIPSLIFFSHTKSSGYFRSSPYFLFFIHLKNSEIAVYFTVGVKRGTGQSPSRVDRSARSCVQGMGCPVSLIVHTGELFALASLSVVGF